MRKTATSRKGKSSHFSWTESLLNHFWDICLEAKAKGYRPGSHIDKRGWNYVLSHFQNISKQPVTRAQLKNKWDGARKDYRLWKSLLGQDTSLGWNPLLQTIDAADEWWDERVQAVKGVAKFHSKGIPPDLCAKYDDLFGDTIVTGTYAFAEVLGTEKGMDGDGTDGESHPLSEGSGDSQDSHFNDPGVDTVGIEMNTAHAESVAPKKFSKTSGKKICKRRNGRHGSKQSQFLETLSDFFDNLSSKSVQNTTQQPTRAPAMADTMADFASFPNVVKSFDFWFWAGELFGDPTITEMYMMFSETRMEWMER